MTSTPVRKGSKRGRRKYDGPTAEEKLVQTLIELMESGTNPWRKEWTTGTNCGQHRNLVTGKPYRGANPLLLEMYQNAKGHPLSLWAGRSQAKEKGWFPVKGCTCAYILRPQQNRRTEEVEVPGKKEKETVTRSWVSYKTAAVFNVADLKGGDEASQAELDSLILKASNIPQTPEPERLARAEDVLSHWPVETNWRGEQAFYQPGSDQITMPLRQLFHSSQALYATWAHETVHSTGHESRLKRSMAHKFGSRGYAREELVAELGAFLICNRLEISSASENHAAYLEHWIEVLKEGPSVLFKVLSDATKASNLILGPEVTEEETEK